MDELPDLLSEAVGAESAIGTVDVGGGDTIVVTPDRTYLYRSEGILKDESVETFDHAVERLSVRTKRRKSSIQLETIDTASSFTVPSDVVDSIIESMIEGILLTNDVIDADENVLALFRFSELTLVVTDTRVFEHVGSAVWDEDFESVEYADLTGLDFERGSVATQVVLETSNRRRRVKVPNEHAGTVRRVIQDAVFESHGVSSMDELRATVFEPEDDASESAPGDTETEAVQGDRDDEAVSTSEDDFVSAGWTPDTDGQSDTTGSGGAGSETSLGSSSDRRSVGPFDSGEGSNGGEGADMNAIVDRIDELTAQIDRQTELIESQQELIERLVDELRRGR